MADVHDARGVGPLEDNRDPIAQTTIEIELVGDLDFGRKNEIARVMMQAAGADVAIIRLGKTAFFDSTALGCLIQLRNTMQERNAESIIILVDPPPQMLKVLDITGLRGMFRCETSKLRSVASKGQRPARESQPSESSHA